MSDIQETAELKARVEALEAENRHLKRRKNYGLVWDEERHADEKVKHSLTHLPYLNFDVSRRVPATDNGVIEHTLIKGDNYLALLALLPKYQGKIDLIYIDPPYNTGNQDFIYNDRYVDEEDGYKHSKWLNFMKPRLELAKKLLAETGVILVAIDDHEYAHLKLLLDEIFGSQNFIANVVWQGGRKNNAKYVSIGSDYMLVYAKSEPSLSSEVEQWRERKPGLDSVLEKASIIWKSAETHEAAQKEWRKWLNSSDGRSFPDAIRRYNSLSESGRPMRTDANISAPGGQGQRYTVLHPIHAIPVPTPTRGWVWNRDRMDREILEGRVHFGPTADKIPSGINYLDEFDNQVKDSVFYQDRNSAATALRAILGSDAFSFPKTLSVIKSWIDYASNHKKDALIIDFFAGSGTTGHAVAELNFEDGGVRSCILVTDQGKADDGGIDIADDVTYERMRRVLTGRDWADKNQHPSLNQALSYAQVAELPVYIRPVVDYDEEDNPVYASDVIVSSPENMRAELMRRGMNYEEATAAVETWKREIR